MNWRWSAVLEVTLQTMRSPVEKLKVKGMVLYQTRVSES